MKRHQKTAPEIVFSVRSLLRHPDPSSRNRGLWGTVQVHQKTQSALRRTFKSFHSEVALKGDFLLRGKRVQVTGRADGLHRIKHGWKLIEIKPDFFQSSDSLDLLESQEQMRYYAALAEKSTAFGRGGKTVEGEIWLVKPNGRVRKVQVSLQDATEALYHRLAVEFDVRRDASKHSSELKKAWPSVAKKMRADFRPIQIEMSDGLSKALACESSAILASPPGTGKTRAVLWTGLRHAIAHGIPVVYFTAKTTGATEALMTLKEMTEAGLPLRVVWLLGRAQTCENCFDWPICQATLPTREAIVRGEISGFLARRPAWDAETLQSYCLDNRFCPYEVNREAARTADLIIADEFFFFEGLPQRKKKPLALIDEVHHIPQRFREHVEIFLSMEDVRRLERYNDAVGKRVRDVLRLLDPRRMESLESSDAVQQEWALMNQTLRAHAADGEHKDSLAKLAHVARWLSSGPKEVQLVRVFRSGRFEGFHLSLADHRPILRRRLEQFHTVIGFSGTLPESDRALCRSVGFPVSAKVLRVGEFGRGEVRILVIPEGQTKYPLRLADFKKAVQLLLQIMKLRPGVYLVFGQSRAYIHELSDMLRARRTFCLEMSREMDEETLRHFFGAPKSKGFVLGPLGGQFSEAVNLPVDLFAGVIVLGPGVSPPTASSEFRRRQLDAEEEDSFDEIYIQPAMARVTQAIGRLIRGPEAKGVALLVDERFAQERYLRHLPRDWFDKSPRELIGRNWRQEIRNV
jgi:DNA excision repair protein ERCC-2